MSDTDTRYFDSEFTGEIKIIVVSVILIIFVIVIINIIVVIIITIVIVVSFFGACSAISHNALIIIIITRPKSAYGRQGLDWIVGPGYSFVVFSTNKTMETNQKP